MFFWLLRNADNWLCAVQEYVNKIKIFSAFQCFPFLLRAETNSNETKQRYFNFFFLEKYFHKRQTIFIFFFSEYVQLAINHHFWPARINIYMCMHISVSIYRNICIYLCVCVYIYIYIYMCLCVCLCLRKKFVWIQVLILREINWQSVSIFMYWN